MNTARGADAVLNRGRSPTQAYLEWVIGEFVANGIWIVSGAGLLSSIVDARWYLPWTIRNVPLQGLLGRSSTGFECEEARLMSTSPITTNSTATDVLIGIAAWWLLLPPKFSLASLGLERYDRR